MEAAHSPSPLETTFPQRRFNSCVCTQGAPLRSEPSPSDLPMFFHQLRAFGCVGYSKYVFPPPFFPARTLILMAERAYADWEYFTFAHYIQPHFIPDGCGAYELIVTVSSRIIIHYWTLDSVLLSPTQGTYRRCSIHAWRELTHTRLMICSYHTRR